MTFKLEPTGDSGVERFQHRNSVIFLLLEAFEKVAPESVCADCPELDVEGEYFNFEDEEGNEFLFWDIVNDDELREKFLPRLDEDEAMELYWKGREGKPPKGKWCSQKFDSHSEWVVIPSEVAVLADIAETKYQDLMDEVGTDYKKVLKDFCDFLKALRDEDENGFTVKGTLINLRLPRSFSAL